MQALRSGTVNRSDGRPEAIGNFCPLTALRRAERTCVPSAIERSLRCNSGRLRISRICSGLGLCCECRSIQSCIEGINDVSGGQSSRLKVGFLGGRAHVVGNGLGRTLSTVLGDVARTPALPFTQLQIRQHLACALRQRRRIAIAAKPAARCLPLQCKSSRLALAYRPADYPVGSLVQSCPVAIFLRRLRSNVDV